MKLFVGCGGGVLSRFNYKKDRLMGVTLNQYKKALESLRIAVFEPKNEFVRDSVIQRFEYTFELAWKTSKKILGSQSVGTKIVIREMAQQGFIEDPEKWFEFLDGRNKSVHSYNEEIAEEIYQLAKNSLPEFERLLSQLEKHK